MHVLCFLDLHWALKRLVIGVLKTALVCFACVAKLVLISVLTKRAEYLFLTSRGSGDLSNSTIHCNPQNQTTAFTVGLQPVSVSTSEFMFGQGLHQPTAIPEAVLHQSGMSPAVFDLLKTNPEGLQAFCSLHYGVPLQPAIDLSAPAVNNMPPAHSWAGLNGFLPTSIVIMFMTASAAYIAYYSKVTALSFLIVLVHEGYFPWLSVCICVIDPTVAREFKAKNLKTSSLSL